MITRIFSVVLLVISTSLIAQNLSTEQLYSVHNSIYYLDRSGLRHYAGEATEGNTNIDAKTILSSWGLDQPVISNITDNSLDTYAISANIRIRPGTYLIQLKGSDNRIYVLGLNRQITIIPYDKVISMFGSDWKNKILHVSEITLVAQGNLQNFTDKYLDGTLIRYQSKPSLTYLVYHQQLVEITTRGILKNRFNEKFIVAAPADIVYPISNIIINDEIPCLTDISETTTCDLINGVKDEGYMNQNFELKQNYPNPFNPTTTIDFFLPAPGNVKLIIYNELGQKVQTVVREALFAGEHRILFDGKQLASGSYFYQLIFNGNTRMLKMQLVK